MAASHAPRATFELTDTPATPRPSSQCAAMLSRTLQESANIRWILPARIRDPSRNDVVLVGTTFVQLHEFLDSGQLVHTGAKLDLGTHIVHAKVVSADLDVVPVVDAILNQERDQERYTLRGRPLDPCQPAQILVLVTGDNDLVFAYARDADHQAGRVQFVFARRSLLRGAGLPPSQCRHVAVDPRSRALALASPAGYFGLFALRPVDEIRDEIDSWRPLQHGSFRPSREQRFIQVDGDIVMMDFLRGGDADADADAHTDADACQVVLLVLVYAAKTKSLHQHLYRWDTRRSVQTTRPAATSGRPLVETALPLMLIPSTRPWSFVLVLEAGISYYENVQSRGTKRIHCPFVGKLAGTREWVQWAKPRRHGDYLERQDDLVIVREDGLLQYFAIEKASTTKFITNNTVGHLGFPVDTAFCMLRGPPGKGGDVIIAGGSIHDGGIFHVSARGVPERTQTLEAAYPLRDLVVGPSAAVAHAHRTPRAPPPLDRLYACCGTGRGRGEVAEIRYGLEAQIGWTMAYPDAAGIDRTWTLETARELLILTSHVAHSAMVAFDFATHDICFTDHDSHPGFDLAHPTLAAGVLDDGHVLQITTAAVHVIPPPLAGHRHDVVLDARRVEQDLLLATCLDAHGTFVSAGRDACLGLTTLKPCRDGPPRPVSAPRTRFDGEPTALCGVDTPVARLVLVGSSAGTLAAYAVQPDLALTPVGEWRVQALAPTVENAPVTALVALTTPGPGPGPSLVLCGLRFGALLCLSIDWPDRGTPKPIVQYHDAYQLGTTSVTVVPDIISLDGGRGVSAAFVLCDAQVQRVTRHPTAAVLDFTLAAVWVTNRADPLFETPIGAVHRIPKLRAGPDDLGGLVVGATADELMFCSLAGQEQAIVKKVAVDGNPRHLLYSPFLQKIVVAFERVHRLTGVAATDKLPHLRPAAAASLAKDAAGHPTMTQVGLHLVEPGLTESPPGGVTMIVTESRDETVTALVDWTPTDGKDHYEWIVLGLEERGPHPADRGGRVLCVNAKSLRKGVLDTNPKTVFKSPRKPVTAVCGYKMSSLLIAAGCDVYLQKLDFSTRKWKTLAKHPLPSPAQAISVQGSMIFVATSRHSLYVLVEHADQLVEHQSDSEAGRGVDIVAFGGRSALFARWHAGSTDLVGFSGFRKDAKDAFAQFHAVLPLFIYPLRPDPGAGAGAGRQRFYGGASDGTIYHFSLLTHAEWTLLHFLEELSYLEKKGVKPVPVAKRRPDGEAGMLKPPPVRLTDMHVRGDRLALMLDPGPYHVHTILTESGRLAAFTTLVDDVLGPTDRPVETAIVWMRKLLQYPARL